MYVLRSYGVVYAGSAIVLPFCGKPNLFTVVALSSVLSKRDQEGIAVWTLIQCRKLQFLRRVSNMRDKIYPHAVHLEVSSPYEKVGKRTGEATQLQEGGGQQSNLRAAPT